MNYLHLSIESQEGLFKDCLKLSLTVDGAQHLNDNPDANLMDLFGTTGQIGDYILHPSLKLIYTEKQVRYESSAMVLLEYTNDSPDAVMNQLRSDSFKGFVYFSPDTEGNKENIKEFTRKSAVDMWAVYSPENIDIAAINIGQRHNQLAKALEHTRNAVMVFNYDKYEQDSKYWDKLNEVSLEIEKELDYCAEKMRMLGIITGNDFNIKEPVQRIYRKFRFVDEVKDKEKYNFKINSDDKIEDTENPVPEDTEG